MGSFFFFGDDVGSQGKVGFGMKVGNCGRDRVECVNNIRSFCQEHTRYIRIYTYCLALYYELCSPLAPS